MDEQPEVLLKACLADHAWVDPAIVRSPDSGYLQHMDSDVIMSLAVRHDLLLKIVKSLGDFIYEQDVVIQVWPTTNHPSMAQP